MAERRGRGRLSAIEQLPEEASDIVVWAANELASRDRLQTDIYAEFREKLIGLQGELGLSFSIPSASSFNRYSTRQAAMARRLEETREIATSLAGRFDGLGNEDLTVVIIETIKTAAYEVLDRRGEAGLKPKEINELAAAVQRIAATSKLSQQQRDVYQRRIDEAAEAAIDTASTLAREAGVSAESIKQMRQEFLGLRPKLTNRPPDTGAPA